MSNPIDKLNAVANQRFLLLKQKLQASSTHLPNNKRDKPNAEKINEKFEEAEKSYIATSKLEDSKSELEEEIFSKIDALKLPANLSLVVSFIVLFNEKQDKESLQRAIQVLESEL